MWVLINIQWYIFLFCELIWMRSVSMILYVKPAANKNNPLLKRVIPSFPGCGKSVHHQRPDKRAKAKVTDTTTYIVLQQKWLWKHVKLFSTLSLLSWADIAKTNHTVQKDCGNVRAELLHVGNSPIHFMNRLKENQTYVSCLAMLQTPYLNSPPSWFTGSGHFFLLVSQFSRGRSVKWLYLTCNPHYRWSQEDAEDFPVWAAAGS